MTHSALVDVLSQIIDLLYQCGLEDRAAWLEVRKVILEDADATRDAREQASRELHRIVLGMGGLMDMSLTPLPGSAYSQISAREQLDRLSDALFEMTK